MSSDVEATAAATTRARAVAEETNLSVRFSDLEQRYVDLEQKYHELFLQQQTGMERIVILEDEKQGLQSTILNLKEELSTTATQLLTEKSAKEEATALATVTQERACRVEAEADNLREEISRLTRSNQSFQAKLASLDTQHMVMDSSSVPLRYEIERFKKEVDALSAHSKWLEEENSRASQELVKTKTLHSQLMIDLRAQLDQTVVERDEYESKSRRIELQKQELEVKMEKLSKDYRDARQEAIVASEASEKELLAERKLVDLQKEQVERVMKRNERLEKELDGLREIAARVSAETDKEFDAIREQIRTEANLVLEGQRQEFNKEIEALKKDLAIARETPFFSPLSARRLLTMNDHEEPMGLTDLYARLNETEDQLQKTRAECEKYRSYVQRVEAEVAAKTPQMLRQRKEYEIAVERLDEMHSRLREALQEGKLYREEATELREELSRTHRRNEELQGEIKDLAKHVQALLASKAGIEVPEGIPTSIEEIQQQNQQLLVEQRRLSSKIEEMQLRSNNDRTLARLQKAEQELETLQEERQRQEKLVASIVQQRDLYRALLSNHEGSPIDLGNTEQVVAQHVNQAKLALERCNALEQDLATARAEVNALKGDTGSMAERIARYATHTKELTLSIDKLQTDLMTANANAAREKADSEYHREKCAHAMQAVEDLRTEMDRLSQVKKEVLAMNAQLHQQLSTARADLVKVENDVQHSEMRLRLSKAQEETAKAAEARLLGEVGQLRSELARQGTLSETIQRIETSLAVKSEEDKEKLKEETDRFKQLLENERLKHGHEIENLQSRIKEFELAIAQAEWNKDEAMKESIAAKGEALAATTERQDLVAKVGRLESEVNVLNKKIGKTVANASEVTLQSTIETLTQDLENAKKNVAFVTERAKNFELMAKASEQELTKLTKASEDFKRGKEKEIQELNSIVATIKEESKKKDEMISELTKDLSSIRGEQETAEAKLKQTILSLESQVSITKMDADTAIARFEGLTSELQKYREDAKKAQNNYERELDLHAEASRDVRALREELASEQGLRRSAEARFENVKLEFTEKEEQLKAEYDCLRGKLKEMEENLKTSREHNDLLLAQLTSLGDKVEKTQSERMNTSTGDSVTGDEVETLRKDISDLREVIKFLRSDREMNEAKIDAARWAAEREKAVSAVTARSLDEARAEIKILQEQLLSASIPSSDAEDRIKKGEEQILLLQESNRLLREEGKKLEETMTSTKIQLEEQRKLVAPLEEKEKEFDIEKAALTADKRSLQRELESWKQRVQSLVSKFNHVDPDEHTKIVKHAESLESEISQLKAQKEILEKDGTNAKSIVSKLNKELAQQKALVQKQQTILKKLQAEKDSALASTSATAAMTKENASLKEKMQKMDAEAKSSQTELKGASDRIEMLKQRMRQFQKIIADQRIKIGALESAAASASPAVESKQTSQHTTSIPQKTVSPPNTADPTTIESKETQSVDAKENVSTEIEKKSEVNASVELTKENLPSAPAGGFKFGPSSTSAEQKKEETQKRPASGEFFQEDSKSTTSSVPPLKKAKTLEKELGSASDHDRGSQVESHNKPAGATSDSQTKAAQTLKDQLLRKREALVQRKKKREEEEEAAKHLAQQTPNKDEHVLESTANPTPAVLAEASTTSVAEPIPETKEKDFNRVDPIAEAKAAVKALANAAVAAVIAKEEESAAAAKSPSEAPQALPFGSSPFGLSTFRSSTTTTFGSPSLGKPQLGEGLVFGSSTSIMGFGSSTTKDVQSTTSSVFLDMKPPSSTAAPFTFGSTSITLPTPSVVAPIAVSSPFDAFAGSKPFGGGASPFGAVTSTIPAALPLFGSSSSIKRPASDTSSSNEEKSAKQARNEEESATTKEGE